jgi:RNase H-fold protein (predicted Holliday junction resolvase)
MGNDPAKTVILGFDPGRLKCGVAVMNSSRQLLIHEVVPAEEAIAVIESFFHQFGINLLVIGDRTTSKKWQEHIAESLSIPLPIVQVDERYSTLEARDRYWQMYPPRGLTRLIPQGMRQPPRAIDDIVAILLIERYLGTLKG